MPDLRHFATRRKHQAPEIKKFATQLDSKYVGFKNVISWEYPRGSALLFNIYRAELSVSALQKNYVLSTIALQRISSFNHFSTNNVELFDKSFIQRNSRVDFENAGSSSRKKLENFLDRSYDYKKISNIRSNRKGLYTFVDQNIKFGKTYSYVISAIFPNFSESPKSQPVIIGVEDFSHPPPPKYFDAKTVKTGILLTVGTSREDRVIGFDLWRRIQKKEKKWTYIDRIFKEKKDKFVNFLDQSLLPGFTAEYKVISVDYFGNKSVDFKEAEAIFDTSFEKKGDVPTPKVEIEQQNNLVKLKCFKNDNDIIGCSFERQDVWRYETGFERKTNNGQSWPNVVFFNSSGVAIQDDLSADNVDLILSSSRAGFSEASGSRVQKGTLTDFDLIKPRYYRYRFTTKRLNGNDATYFVTPPLNLSENFVYRNFEEDLEEEEGQISIRRFNVDLLSKKRDPLAVKFSWDINGDWDYLIITIGQNKIRVDSSHEQIFYQKLERKRVYPVAVEVFDFEENIADSERQIILST